MNELLSISSICAGFVAGVLFCLNAASTTAQSIFEQAGTYFDHNSAVAQSLAVQHAQYFVGAAYLLCSFGLQAVALLITQEPVFPSWFPKGLYLFLFLLVSMSLIAWVLVALRVSNIKGKLQILQQQELERTAQQDALR